MISIPDFVSDPQPQGDVIIRRHLFDRWIVTNAADENYAWSGSRWVKLTGGAQLIAVSNYTTPDDAADHARVMGFNVLAVAFDA